MIRILEQLPDTTTTSIKKHRRKSFTQTPESKPKHLSPPSISFKFLPTHTHFASHNTPNAPTYLPTYLTNYPSPKSHAEFFSSFFSFSLSSRSSETTVSPSFVLPSLRFPFPFLFHSFLFFSLGSLSIDFFFPDSCFFFFFFFTVVSGKDA